MSTYADLIAVISGLVAGTEVEITKEWCGKHGLTVDGKLARKWGGKVKKEFANIGLREKVIHPGGGDFVNKTSDNLRHWIKV